MPAPNEAFVKPKSVRLPTKIYEKLVAEAAQTGAGKPAVLARMIVIERVRKGKLEPLAEMIKNKIQISLYDPKFNIRLSEDQLPSVNAAVQTAAGGSFSSLVQAILIERYS